MIYPKFLNNNDIIGITALSGGMGKYLDNLDLSVSNIKKHGFNIEETKDVRSKDELSISPEEKVKEFNNLINNKKISMIIGACGGDFTYQTLPYYDFNIIKNNPKWIMGSSDITFILYMITTYLDISTIYGFNASSFDSKKLHKSQELVFDIIKGNIPHQDSYDKYEINKKDRIDNNYNLEIPVKWELLNNDFNITGRIIGGCLDCLRYLPGTKYDYTSNFIERYKKDGIIWYFDVFSLTAEDFYLTLLQLKENNWFKYIKGVIVGRVKFPNSYTEMTYQDALKKVFGNIPIAFNADIGHVVPKMTIINGSIAHIICKNNKGKIEQILE